MVDSKLTMLSEVNEASNILEVKRFCYLVILLYIIQSS